MCIVRLHEGIEKEADLAKVSIHDCFVIIVIVYSNLHTSGPLTLVNLLVAHDRD